MAAMYVAMLLTDWFVTHSPLRNNALKASYRNFVKEDKNDPDQDVYIGRSVTAMWMRVVSSWVCMLLYIWSLIAPVVMPDR
jgi:serine incorporator 1/3